MKDEGLHSKYEDEIVENYPNVVGFKADKEDEEVRIYVSEKVAEDSLDKEEILPKELEGYKTDILEIDGLNPEDTFYGVDKNVEPQAPGHTKRYDVVRPGISIGHVDVTAGTLGAFVKNKDGEVQILSNDHVSADVNKGEIGDKVLQPGPYDGGDVKNDFIGELKKSGGIKNGTTIDAATNGCKRSYLLDPKGKNVPKPKGVGEPQKGDQVVKSGRTTGETEGKITDVGVSLNVSYGGQVGTVRLKDQIITTNMSKGGDSGSLLIRKSDEKAVGLLFAGSSKVTIHNKIQNVLDELEVSLMVGKTQKPEKTVSASSWNFGFGEVAYFSDSEMLPDGDFNVKVYDDKLVIPRDPKDK